LHRFVTFLTQRQSVTRCLLKKMIKL